MAKILIIDDSQVIRVRLREALEEGGHEVIEAVDGAEGLAKAEATPGIQLVIADYNLPMMDGVTMCGRIRRIPEYARIPLFVLTSETSAEIKAAGKANGVMAWIVKPFNKDAVLELIGKVVPRG